MSWGQVTGRSFGGLLGEPGRAWKRGAFTVVSRGAKLVRSVRTARYRYAEWVGDSELNELYDLESDPRELANLAKKTEYQLKVQDLNALLKAGPTRTPTLE